VLPGGAWAAIETGSATDGVGRVLGMMLFAYLALKWFNRKRDRNEIDVRVEVLPVNVAPVASHLCVHLARNGSAVIDLSKRVSDVEGDTLNLSLG